MTITMNWSKFDLLAFELKKTYFYWQKAQDTNSYDIIIAGDSRTLYAIDSAHLKEKLSKSTAKNFSFPSNSWTMEYLDYLNGRLGSNGVFVFGLSYESLTSFQSDEFFQDAKKIKAIYL